MPELILLKVAKTQKPPLMANTSPGPRKVCRLELVARGKEVGA